MKKNFTCKIGHFFGSKFSLQVDRGKIFFAQKKISFDTVNTPFEQNLPKFFLRARARPEFQRAQNPIFSVPVSKITLPLLRRAKLHRKKISVPTWKFLFSEVVKIFIKFFFAGKIFSENKNFFSMRSCRKIFPRKFFLPEATESKNFMSAAHFFLVLAAKKVCRFYAEQNCIEKNFRTGLFRGCPNGQKKFPKWTRPDPSWPGRKKILNFARTRTDEQIFQKNIFLHKKISAREKKFFAATPKIPLFHFFHFWKFFWKKYFFEIFMHGPTTVLFFRRLYSEGAQGVQGAPGAYRGVPGRRPGRQGGRRGRSPHLAPSQAAN